MIWTQTPVADRECGECTLCCIVLLIDSPQMQKEAGVTCRHCAGGCAIYQTRPPVCRSFYCAWRTMDIFGPEWRPDKSGVFAQIETEDISERFELRAAIGLMLVGNPLKTVRQSWFIDFVAAGVRMGIPLFLSLPGPRGHQAAKLPLNNDEICAAAMGGMRGKLKDGLEKALKRLSGYGFERYAMINSGNDTGR